MNRYTKGFVQLSFALLIFLIVGGVFILADTRPRLRFVHAAPGVANVDVYVDDPNLVFENVFYSFVTDYVPIKAGDHTVKVRPAGAGHKEPVLVDIATNPYNDNEDYTIIIAGKAGRDQGDIQFWRLVDDNKNLPGTGTSKVRIVHASFGTPATEFCLNGVCHTLSFRENSGYFLMDPGLYFPEVYLNGTDFPKINIPPLKLQDNSIHTIYFMGRSQNEPRLQLVYSLDAGEPSGSGTHPLPPNPGPNPQPPIYPPVTGAFLSPKLMGMMAGIVLAVAGGIAIWATRRTRKSA
jgi:hypothetical protein